MTVPVQVPFTASIANGVTTTFPYAFKITDAADLEVSVDDVVVTTGFTVTGVGAELGGSVIFSVAPANGLKVLRALAPLLKRTTDYQQFGDWTADVVDNDFDRVWLALQAISQSNARSLKLPKDTATDQVVTEDAAARAGLMVSFDGSGNMALYTLANPASLLLPLSVVQGGTGSGVAATALTNLGAAASGANVDITSLKGTITNDSAAEGKIGEYITAVGSMNAPATNTFGAVVTINLTAGDWDVSGVLTLFSTNATGFIAHVGCPGVPMVPGDNKFEVAGASMPPTMTASIPSVRFSLAAPQTCYLNGFATYPSGTPTMAGRISARRVR